MKRKTQNESYKPDLKNETAIKALEKLSDEQKLVTQSSEDLINLTTEGELNIKTENIVETENTLNDSNNSNKVEHLKNRPKPKISSWAKSKREPNG